MTIKSQAAGFILKELISLGRKRIRGSDSGDEIVKAVKEKFNYDVTSKENAAQVLAALRDPLLAAMDEFAAESSERALAAVEAIEPQVAKRTFLQSYGELGGQAQFVVWILVLFCAISTGLFGFMVYTTQPLSVDMMILGFAVPFATLIGLCTLPVKSVAYVALTIGSKAISSKLSK